jgi:hypothetical protein
LLELHRFIQQLTNRWKKQIFTEAEMVEQAVSADAVKEKDLIDLETQPESTRESQEKPDDKSAPDEGDQAEVEPQPQAEKKADHVTAQPQPEAAGYAVEEESEHPATYAEAVKEHTREVTIQEEVEPDSPVGPAGITETPNEDEEQESTTLLHKGKGKIESPSTPAKSSIQTDEARDQVPSPRRPAATPTRDRPVSFPVMPRSQSHNSDLMSPQSGASTPSRSPSHANLSESVSNTSAEHGQGTPDDKGGKTRKRLTSLKKMVRRISDQGSGLVRSNSTGRPGSRSGGLASPSPDAGNAQKKLPLQRGDSTGPGPQ